MIYLKYGVATNKRIICSKSINVDEHSVMFDDGKVYRKVKLSEVTDWISIKDIVPTGDVIGLGFNDEMIMGYIDARNDSNIYCENESQLLSDITHWKPKPLTPLQRKLILNLD